jgi:hypothetical protein
VNSGGISFAFYYASLVDNLSAFNLNYGLRSFSKNCQADSRRHPGGPLDKPLLNRPANVRFPGGNWLKKSLEPGLFACVKYPAAARLELAESLAAGWKTSAISFLMPLLFNCYNTSLIF